MAFLNIKNDEVPIQQRELNSTSFFFIVGLLAITNFVFSVFLDLQGLRVVRLITTVVFFIWFLSLSKPRNVLFNSVFVLIVLSDLGLFYYENKWFCFLRFGTFILINILLCYHIFNRSFFKKLKPFALAVIFVLSVSCVFLVVNLSYLIDFTVFGKVHEFLFYIYTLSTFLLIFFTVLYSLNDYSKKIDIFLGATVAFLVSDLLLMIGYYQKFYIAIQIERVFQVLAIALLIYYVVLYNQDRLNKKQR